MSEEQMERLRQAFTRAAQDVARMVVKLDELLTEDGEKLADEVEAWLREGAR